MSTKCCLKLKNDQKCYGLITKRNITADLKIDCCEAHIIAYKEIEFLVENGYDTNMVKELTRKERLILINELKKGKK